MRLVVVYPPRSTVRPLSGVTPGHAVYRSGNGGHLYRAEAKAPPSGGIMSVDAATASGPPALLAGEIMREASARGFSGILLDMPPERGELARLVGAECKKRGVALYLPERSASAADGAVALVETAIRSGALGRRLNEAASRFGTARTALDIERVRMDFTLPVKDAAAAPLELPALRALLSKTGAKPFFSNELCAWYFNYSTGGKTHFVLFDNAESIRRKLALAVRLGIQIAFLYYPEVSDILDDVVIPPGRRS